ncbi:MAG: hypothetical protein ACM31M_01575 [Nitrososphaerota archaeon]
MSNSSNHFSTPDFQEALDFASATHYTIILLKPKASSLVTTINLSVNLGKIW